MITIYAGVDVDQVVKLFFVIDHKPVHVRLQDWWQVQDELGAEPGEMLTVTLSRDADREDYSTVDRERQAYLHDVEVDRKFLQQTIRGSLPPGSSVAVEFDLSNRIYSVEATVPGMTHPPARLDMAAEFVEDDRFGAAAYAINEIMRRPNANVD